MIRTVIYLLLGHLLIVYACSSCASKGCSKCNVTAECCKTFNKTQQECNNDFEVCINTSKSKIKEGDDVTLTCQHDLPDKNLIYEWIKNEEVIKGQNSSQLILKEVLSNKNGKYACYLKGECGVCKSLPHEVTVNGDPWIIILVCGVSALALIVILGLAMRFKLKRDNAKHKERMKQRAEAGQSGGPMPFRPR